MGGPDTALGEAHSNAADFLDRPADEGLVGAMGSRRPRVTVRGKVFGSAA
jgi:hypothetical protein